MTTNDDLDDFFKKKDRKTHKHKKQTGLLSNNEELLKQLGKQIRWSSSYVDRCFCFPSSDCHIGNIGI